MDTILSLMNQNLIFIVIVLLVITIILLIAVISLLIAVNKVESKYRKMMRGTNNKNLEELITNNLDRIDSAVEKSKETMDNVKLLEEELKKSVKKVSITRYKAFNDVGSDLSFSIAMLDSFNDGIVITGIYSRHDSTTYAKPIDKGISRYDLSQEEVQVLKEAINKN